MLKLGKERKEFLRNLYRERKANDDNSMTEDNKGKLETYFRVTQCYT